MNVCVIIPAFNVETVVRRIVEQVRAQGVGLCVVDDGSFDNTGDEARAAGAVVLTHRQNQGKGAAVMTGFKYAIAQAYEGVIVMDADGQHAPSDLVVFLRAAQEPSVGVIVGNRMSTAAGTMPFVRLVTNRVMSWMVSRLCGCDIPDTQCGFRYLRMEFVRQLRLEAAGYESETEMLAQCARLGAKIISVPIQTIYGDEVSHIRPVRDTIRFFRLVARLRRSNAAQPPGGERHGR